MNLPTEGQVTIRYKVLRRNIDESGKDGPHYGAVIEVQSIDPDGPQEEAGPGQEAGDRCRGGGSRGAGVEGSTGDWASPKAGGFSLLSLQERAWRLAVPLFHTRRP